MPGYWFHRNYPKTSAKIGKGIVVWLILSVSIGYVYDTFIHPPKIEKQILLSGQSLKEQAHQLNNDTAFFSLKLAKYPDVSFQYRNPDYLIIDTVMLQKIIKTGDTLSLLINENDFINKYKKVSLTGVVYKNKTYPYSNPGDSDKNSYIFFGVIILIGLVTYLILDITGVIDRIKDRYFKEPATPLTSLEDFTGFPE